MSNPILQPIESPTNAIQIDAAVFASVYTTGGPGTTSRYGTAPADGTAAFGAASWDAHKVGTATDVPKTGAGIDARRYTGGGTAATSGS